MDQGYASDESLHEDTPVTYQSFYPGQLVIVREFPEGSLKDYRRCTCMVGNIAGSPNTEITIYKVTKEFIDDGHSFPITSQQGLVFQTITGPIQAATVNFPLMHDPSFVRTSSAYTCDPSVPIRDGRRSVESLGSVVSLDDVNRFREFIAKTEFRPLVYPLISGPQIRHPPDDKGNVFKAHLRQQQRRPLSRGNDSDLILNGQQQRRPLSRGNDSDLIVNGNGNGVSALPDPGAASA